MNKITSIKILLILLMQVAFQNSSNAQTIDESFDNIVEKLATSSCRVGNYGERIDHQILLKKGSDWVLRTKTLYEKYDDEIEELTFSPDFIISAEISDHPLESCSKLKITFYENSVKVDFSSGPERYLDKVGNFYIYIQSEGAAQKLARAFLHAAEVSKEDQTL